MNKEEARIKKFIKTWDGVEIEDWFCEMSDVAKLFSRDFKSTLKVICTAHGFELLTHKTGHYDFFGFIRKDNVCIYYSYVMPRGHSLDLTGKLNRWCDNILIRYALHEKDYTGGKNEFCDINEFSSKMESIYLRYHKKEDPLLENKKDIKKSEITPCCIKKKLEGQVSIFDIMDIA